ncbi:MAG: ParA family protein [Cyclobacteriaceae bacterium]|nr:ParA family protein [Cyclobacteriaceae bacterium]
MGEIITIINQKGGTGKTTTSVNLSTALAQLGKRVIVVDFDPQGNLTYSFGFMEFEGSISTVLQGVDRFDDVILESEGVNVVPSDTSLADVEVSLISRDDREFALKNAMQTHLDYDYIIIDCPPALSLLAVNALVASDSAIIPMQLEVMSLQGLNQITKTIEKINKNYNKHIEIKGILPVMVDRRRNLDMEVEEFIMNNYELNIFKTHIRTNVRASEAPSFGKSVINYAPRSNSALDYLNFAKELIN